jgi:trehalose 6-phosphate synthase/phosphatase
MEIAKRKIYEQKLVIVSNRLPVSVSRKKDVLEITPSVGGLATGLASFHRDNDGLWIGWPGIDPGKPSEKRELEQTLKDDFNCFPVYLSLSQMKKYYYGFSNRTLWPLFHYFLTFCTYDAGEWESYKRVNQHFCDRILSVASQDDLIWVHDYHLLLLPQLIREKMPEATIGLFLHIPFPSMEVFRYLPWREDILQGMLGADLIGFHTYDYSRHFLSSVLRILGEENEYGQVIHNNRSVKVDTFPMGIDAKKFVQAVETSAVKKEQKTLANRLKAEKIILSVDRLDFTKGIPERLRAFEVFLEKYPEWIGKISYIMLCVPSRTQVQQYQLLKREVDELVGRINGRFGTAVWSPIHYLYRSVSFDKLVSLYCTADVAVVTPLRDGMNLVAKEYLACQSKVKKGVLILSETAGSAAELGEAVIVNPNDMNQIADALHQALKLSQEEKQDAIETMSHRIERYNVFRWAEDFIEQVLHTKEHQAMKKQRFLTKKLQNQLAEDYQRANSRLFLLDYDGTMVNLVKKPELAKPDSKLLEILSTLVQNPRNTVVVISGRERDSLTKWLLKTGADIVAEHGTWLKYADQNEWVQTYQGMAMDWKDNIRPILNKFSERTPGSFVEEKSHSLAWHYRNAEPEMGSLRAKELIDALRNLLSATALQVLQGNKVVEVKPVDINKGKTALSWLDKQSWDFIIAIGDDWTDEDTFSVLPEKAWSIKVGFISYTKARYVIDSPSAVRELLQKLCLQ